MSLLARASVRHFRRHPWQLGLAALGIALGVGLAVGVEASGASVRRAFALSTESVAGRATAAIFGGPTGIPEEIYRKLRVELGVRAMAPFVGGAVTAGSEVLELLGVDPFAENEIRPFVAWNAPQVRGALGDLVAKPGTVALSRQTAKRLRLRTGDAFEVRVGPVRRSLTAAVIFDPLDERERALFDGLLLCDVSTAQETLDQVGFLARIDLRVDDAELARIAAVLPPSLRIEPVGARAGALLAMTRAFDLNLRALSLLALLVGAFLVYGSTTFSVVQRRSLLGLLRALGATRRELLVVVILEGAVLGLVGAAVGLGLGVLLARGLVHLVSRAVSDLYFVVSVREVAVPWVAAVGGAGLGLAAAVLSTLPAGREATTVEPRLAQLRSHVETRARRRAPAMAALGGLLGVAAVLLLVVTARSLEAAFAAMLLIVLGTALVTPGAVWLAARVAEPVFAALGGFAGRIAARGVAAALSRTGIAAAALAAALSVSVGVSVMVTSFRSAVEDWLGDTLRADVYVTVPSQVAARNEARLPRGIADQLAALAEVAATSTARNVVIAAVESGPTFVTAVEVARDRGPKLRLRAGALEPFTDGAAVLVSEPFAYKQRIGVGGVVTLATKHGPRPFPVAGVYRDYASDAGVVLVARALYDRHFDDPFVSSVALYARPGLAPEALASAARASLPDGYLVRTNAVLRRTTLEIFDRTFEITAVLRLLALLVAAIGVMSSLLAISLERTREMGILRALGFTPGQVASLLALETSLLGLVAGLVALPVGVGLAAVLVFAINRRSFGWTMDLVWASPALAVAPLLGLIAGLAGGLYPSLRMARTSPAEALRNE